MQSIMRPIVVAWRKGNWNVQSGCDIVAIVLEVGNEKT